MFSPAFVGTNYWDVLRPPQGLIYDRIASLGQSQGQARCPLHPCVQSLRVGCWDVKRNHAEIRAQTNKALQLSWREVSGAFCSSRNSVWKEAWCVLCELPCLHSMHRDNGVSQAPSPGRPGDCDSAVFLQLDRGLRAQNQALLHNQYRHPAGSVFTQFIRELGLPAGAGHPTPDKGRSDIPEARRIFFPLPGSRFNLPGLESLHVLQTEHLCPPPPTNSYVETLPHDVIVFGDEPLGGNRIR